MSGGKARKKPAQPMTPAVVDPNLFDHMGPQSALGPMPAPARRGGRGDDRNSRQPEPADDDRDGDVGSDVDDKAGHRRRLFARLMTTGAAALADYELLELILFRVYARKDTKPVAKLLLRELGSFAEVISAPDERLLAIEGIGPRVVEELRLIQGAAQRLQKGRIVDRHILASWDAVLEYLKAAQAFDATESFRILFLDKRNKMLADEVQHTGTVDHTPVYIREVVKRALELGATSLILVHNHPSGDPTPSGGDIAMTKQIVAAVKPLNIVIHDHIIVGREGHYSMRGAGLI